MATYKVIQDVEAEDKLVGPLTLRQFIYAMIGAASFYLSYLVASRGAVFLMPFLLVPGLIATFFAIPWGKDQSTEIWALARIRFMFFPRKRIWNQSGTKNLVTVTAPKRPEQVYTDGLSQIEVKSRLSALAKTIDSRGWALKDSVLLSPTVSTPSDRLVASSAAPRDVPTLGAEFYEDVLDEHVGVGQKFDTMLSANAQAAHSKLATTLSDPSPAQPTTAGPTPTDDYWFLNQTGASQQPIDGAVFSDAVVHPGQTATTNVVEDAQAQALEAIISDPGHTSGNLQNNMPKYGHVAIIKPLSEQVLDNQPVVVPIVPVVPPTPAPVAPIIIQQPTQPPIVPAPIQLPPEPPVTATPSADILNLSRSNDLSVATLSRQAKKDDENEVTISLH